MNKVLAGEILEAAYDSFLEDFIQDMRDHGLPFEDACEVWVEAFGIDSQDPLVDWALDRHFDWAIPDYEEN